MTERKLRNSPPSNETAEASLQEQTVVTIASSLEQPVRDSPNVELHLRLVDDVLVLVQYAPIPLQWSRLGQRRRLRNLNDRFAF